MKSRCVFLTMWILLFAVSSSAVSEAGMADAIDAGTYYVAPGGNDAWSGRIPEANADRTDGPLATLRAARDAARRLKPDQPRQILVLEGQYFLEKSLELDARDNRLTIAAMPGAKVVLYGGRKVTGWEKDGDKFYSAALPGVKEGTWDFRALVVNGRLCRRARLPRKGAFHHLNTLERERDGGGRRRTTEEERLTLQYDPKEIGPWLDVNNAEIRLYHMWDESLVGVAANDTQRHVLKLSSLPGYAPGAFNMKKYILWNVREGMTDPGQWYLDRTEGKLVYWPLPGEEIGQIEAIVPIAESVIRIHGSKDKPARGITLRGMALSVTTTPLAAGGFGAGKFDGAVSLAFAEGCRLQELEIFNVSGYGIKARQSNFRVESCHLHHIGAGGIRSGGRDVVITNNHIHDVGLLYPSGIGIWSGGRDARISHNEIHDMTYSGIDCGGRGHRIEQNLIYRVMEELYDGGGIYTHGAKEAVIRGNFVRDIVGNFHGDTGAWSYYLDERSENCLVEGNLSVNVPWPTHHHMAKNNTIRNNFFIANMDKRAQLQFPVSSNYVFEKNVVYAKGAIMFTNFEAMTTFADNVIFSEKGRVDCHKLKAYTTVAVYPLEATNGNVLSDPLLTNYENGVVRLAPDSPALALGIEPIDVSSAGRR